MNSNKNQSLTGSHEGIITTTFTSPFASLLLLVTLLTLAACGPSSEEDSTPPPPPPELQIPIIELSVFPPSIDSGGSVSLNWTVSRANYCFAAGGWSGLQNATSGNAVVNDVHSYNNRFTLICSGEDGESSQAVDVNIGVRPPEDTGFVTLTDEEWNEMAVRKVLHAFAYGGLTSDQQIELWANLPPNIAIAQMLNFDEHNPRLAIPNPNETDGIVNQPGTLLGISDFWQSDAPDNLMPEAARFLYNMTHNGGGVIEDLWMKAASTRGLNPFRQKIGIWETNYHMAITRAVVQNAPLRRYYDDIMEAHAAGLPYHEVMAKAAKSVAIALQYGHRNNRYINGECRCNEDFAREFHQLFFGILGESDPLNHEQVTIKNTALMLTDMPVPFIGAPSTYPWEIEFGTANHYPGPLNILGTNIVGIHAGEKIDHLASVAIEHPESLANLPVMIVQGLADDNLDAAKKNAIREAWSSMPEKNLLEFLRGYATSTTFHSPSRVKYHHALDRRILTTNRITTSNLENNLGLYARYTDLRYKDNYQIFTPAHVVFGGQTGEEASRNSSVFLNNYNDVIDDYWRFMRTSPVVYDTPLTKDWLEFIPANKNNEYITSDIAEWLWQHYTADNLKNFKPLERAHVYSLLAAREDIMTELGLDFELDTLDDNLLSTGNNPLEDYVQMLGEQPVLLDQPGNDAIIRVGLAVNFIMGTPYVMAQEGQ